MKKWKLMFMSTSLHVGRNWAYADIHPLTISTYMLRPQVVPPLPYLNEYALRNLYGNVIQEEGGVGGWKPLLWNAKAERTH